MAVKYIEKTLKLKGKGDLIIRPAKIRDARRIQVLYTEVYGSSYSISTVMDMGKLKSAVSSDNYYWLVAEFNNKIVASLAYIIDFEGRIAKAFGAVIESHMKLFLNIY
jgi:hypothetical protein